MAEENTSRYEAFAEDADPAVEPLDDAPQSTLERLARQFGEGVLRTSNALGEATAVVDAKVVTELMTWLRDEGGFALLSDVTSHDCNQGADPRFYVVYHLLNFDTPERLRVKVGLPEKKPVVASVTPIWPGANFLEREVYDLMGIEFAGHPNLKRIMLPEEWEGHPLRKDFPAIYEEVQFTHNMQEIAARKPFAKR